MFYLKRIEKLEKENIDLKDRVNRLEFWQQRLEMAESLKTQGYKIWDDEKPPLNVPILVKYLIQEVTEYDQRWSYYREQFFESFNFDQVYATNQSKNQGKPFAWKLITNPTSTNKGKHYDCC